MNLFYFVQKYLNKLDDYKFVSTWEQKFMNNMRRFVSIIFTIYVIIVVGIGALVNIDLGFFWSLLIMMFFGAWLGYLTFIQFLRFLAINNERFMRLKMGGTESGINYDNVVG